MDQNAENTNRPLALILTIGSHGIILLIFLFYYITTPNPPYPEGGGSGLGVNFGTSEDGSGDVQPEEMLPMNLEEPVHTEKVNHKATSKEDDVETQNSEETVSIKTHENKKNKKEEIVETKESKVEKKREVDKKTLFKGTKNTDSKSEGETHGSGDQGKKEGNPNSKYHWGSGNGTGNGDGVGDGKGNGDGDGDGDGKNNKKGIKNGNDKKGISFNLKGRKAKTLPLPEYNDNDDGKVVVEVIVDREGNVTKATEGKGTTTSSIVLKKAAKRAAMTAKFSKNPDAAEFQKGTITYIFKQQ